MDKKKYVLPAKNSGRFDNRRYGDGTLWRKEYIKHDFSSKINLFNLYFSQWPEN